MRQWTQATEEERAQLIRPLIFRWTGVFEQSASPLPGLSDGRMLAALEALFGQRYRNGAGIQGEIPGQQLEKVFNDFAEVTSALLESNKLLSPIIQRLDFTWDNVSENFVINVEQAAQYLVETQAAAPSAAHLKRLRIALLGASDFGSELLDAFKKLALQSDDKMRLVLLAISIENPILGTFQADSIAGTVGIDFMDGSSGDDTIQAGDGADSLVGGEGNDTIYGESGDDVIDGGGGDDVLYGGMGNDVYLFGKGDGKDVIGSEYFYWWDGQSIGHNVLTLKSGVTADELRLTRIGDGLVVSIEGTDDSITASNFFYANDPNSGFNTLQEVRFADGSSWDRAELLKSKGLTGTAGSDALFGSVWSDLISGLGGDDALYGLEGDDMLIGGLGNDQIIAGNGDDVLIGSAGNDQLFGGLGGDIYSFGRGDGVDVIVDNDVEQGKFNRLSFREDVAPSDVLASRAGEDLVLAILHTSDSVRVVDFYRSANPFNPYNSIQQIGFVDGSVWGLSDFC